MSLATLTSLTFVPGATLLICAGAAFSPGLQPLHFERGVDASFCTGALRVLFVLTTVPNQAAVTIAIILKARALSTFGGYKSLAAPLFRDAFAAPTSRAPTFFGAPP